MRIGWRVTRRLGRAAAVLAAAAAPAAGAAQDCTPPPAVPDTSFTVQNGQPWRKVNEFLINAGVMFPLEASHQDTVVPCPRCGLADLRAWTTQASNCLSQEVAAQDSLRFVGMVTWSSGAQPGTLGFGPNNVNQVVYLLVKGNQGLALYQNQSNRTQWVRFVARRQGWRFVFHPDVDHPQPEARWRDTMLAMRQVRHAVAYEPGGGPAAPGWGDDDGVLQTGVSYVWIACAAGCCQFHGTSDGGQGQDGDHRPHPRPGPPPPPPGAPHPSRR